MTKYKEHDFVCISKGDVELPNITDEDKELLKHYDEEYKPLKEYIKNKYKNITDVKLSTKVTELPCVICAPENGFSANMEKILKTQTLGDTNNISPDILNKRVLELNPHHKIVKYIKNIKEEDKVKVDLLSMVIDSALLYSGYSINKPVEYSQKVIKMVMIGLNIDDEDDSKYVIQNESIESMDAMD